MRTKTMVQAAILVALGALLGYAAASGRLRPDWFAAAANPAKEPAADKPSDGAACPDCCSKGVSREQLVALAGHNAADDPKKPVEPPFDPDQVDQTGEKVADEVIRPKDARTAAWMAFTQALVGSAEFRYVR